MPEYNSPRTRNKSRHNCSQPSIIFKRSFTLFIALFINNQRKNKHSVRLFLPDITVNALVLPGVVMIVKNKRILDSKNSNEGDCNASTL